MGHGRSGRSAPRGDVNVPQCPAVWVHAVHTEHQSADEGHAHANGLEPTAYRSAARNRVTELLSGTRVRMRLVRDALTDWLREGEYRTMWDGVRVLGEEHRRQREAVEERVLGIPKDAPISARPRYGYCSDSDEHSAEVNSYGYVIVTLSDDVARRATVLFGDSVGSTNGAETMITAPVPVRSATLDCRYGWRDVLPVDMLADACDQRYRYAEVQIYGPLVPADINEILFCCGVRATDELRLLMDRYGLVYDEIEDLP